MTTRSPLGSYGGHGIPHYGYAMGGIGSLERRVLLGVGEVPFLVSYDRRLNFCDVSLSQHTVGPSRN